MTRSDRPTNVFYQRYNPFLFYPLLPINCSLFFAFIFFFSLSITHTHTLFITLTPIRILLSTNDKPNISSSTRVMGKAGTFMRMYLTLRNASPLYILTRRLYIHLMQLIAACWPSIVYRMLNVVLLIAWNWIIAAYSAWMSTYHIARQWHISLSLVTCM